MSMPQLIPNMMQGNTGAVAKGIQALGMPPVGNAGGSNMPGPTAVNGAITPIPGALPNPASVNPIMQTGVQPIMQNAVNAGTPNTLVAGGPQGAIPTANQPAQDKQLTDVYGAGIGGDINSVINNLGSNDSTYMQAYSAAMAQPNAENLATLQTTLGNAGIGMNSSTAAIAQSDLLTGETSQEGLQEQQLQQTDQQDLIGLLTSTEGAANKEASTSVWGDIGSVLGSVGSDAATAAGAIAKLF